MRRASLALVAVAAGIGAFWVGGFGAWQVYAFLILPDVALLAGFGGGLERGQLHPRAVPLYNALHVPAGPAVLALMAIPFGRAWLGGGLAWLAHIALDQALGYGLRTRTGFQRA